MRSAVWSLLVAFPLFAEEPVLPGTPVSRPLTPVEEPAKLPAPAEVLPESAIEIEKSIERADLPLPGHWSHYDFMLTWAKSQPLPVLVNRDGAAIVGGRGIGNSAQAGFRFGMGWSSNAERDAGWEFEGLFLGTRISRVKLSEGELSRPFTNSNLAKTGPWFDLGPSPLIVNGSGFATGSVQVTTTTRVQGWEVSGVKNLLDAGDIKLSAIGGYRYFAANEGLHVYQQSLYAPRLNQPATLWGIYDQFDARNNFHGGQIGFILDHVGTRWLVSLRATVALGSNFETVQATGRSSATTAALPVPAVQPYGAGFLAVNSNNGRALESHFAVLPEARLNIGYRLGSNCCLIAGYDFMYLSNVVRPGDQVDATVNPSQVPILGGTAGPAFVGSNRPAIPFNRTDFWVQGLVLGFDCRY